MEALCLAPTHNFTSNPKSTTISRTAAIPAGRNDTFKISTTGRNMKMGGSRVRPSALPLKMSQLISLADSSAPVVSAPASLQDIEAGKLIENNPTGGDSEELVQYLLEILASRVYDVAIESPLQHATKLSKRLGLNLFIKREDMQSVFSFKLRGAYNMMTKLTKEQLERGVITASAGNHAQGVALGAQRLQCTAKIVMPVTTPVIKREAVENLGGRVVLEGDTFDEAQSYALKLAQDEGLTFIPPFDHPDVIIGQGTIGTEINRQLKDIHAVFVPVGGGGLIAGVAAYFKKVAPNTKIIGVEPFGASSMTLSLHHGERIKLEQVDNFADGVAVALVGEETFRLCKDLIDGMVLVGRDAISAAVKDVYEEGRNILETSGALAIAGAEAYCKYYNIKDENVVAIASGANMDFSKLKLVVDLADIGGQREALLATFMPEEPGSFKKFCEQVDSLNITECTYRYSSGRKQALVLYSVDVHKKSDLDAVLERMKSLQFNTVNLSNNDLVKEHLRHLMGGRSDPSNEIFCQFIFPEKPGALRKFLDAFSPRWNITLFHYREQGELDASVFVGFQVSQGEMKEFQNQADQLGYSYEIESLNEASKLIIE
ncbi:threonine dehydratase-like [Lycium ferocissimum]|uniref:threonine dehydratase-like n=1 Tax=Lycium ferocissimum TaxID=112874 RepID=UPI002815CCE9|nr:threonine dehydratase-like [Lycium ferocissimum]